MTIEIYFCTLGIGMREEILVEHLAGNGFCIAFGFGGVCFFIVIHICISVVVPITIVQATCSTGFKRIEVYFPTFKIVVFYKTLPLTVTVIAK